LSAPVAEPMVETELWISFVSLLRSYAAAASLASGKVAVVSNNESVTISAFAVQIEMKFDSKSGQGTWEKRVAGHAVFPDTFAIRPEGTIHINGAVRDLDHAAIDLIASVAERGKETS
jgi:hypothetical protein